jgi:hypothetical protein
MVDWDTALEIAIAGAPAAAVTLLAVWLVWFARRLVRGIRMAFRKDRRTAEPRPERSKGVGVRIEPTLEPVPHADPSHPDHDRLVESLRALTERVEELEQRLALVAQGQRTGQTPLRLVKNEDLQPV